MKGLKSVLLKIVEFIGYALLINYVFKLVKGGSKPSVPESVTDAIDSEEQSSQDDLSASEKKHDEEIERIDDESQKIVDLDGNALTSEFDREFGGVQVVSADGSD